MSKVFISYSSKDQLFVTKLAKDLLTHQIPVWLDSYEISLGDSLYDKVFPAIEECNYIIVVLSENYNRTIWTAKEYQAVLEKEKRDKRKYLIPIRIDVSEIPEEIKERLYQDFSDHYEQSLRTLVRYFSKEGSNIAAIPIEQRQVILNLTDLVNVDTLLIKTVLFDIHLQPKAKVSKKQIYLNGLGPVDELLDDAERNMPAFKDNYDFTRQFRNDKLRVEALIDGIHKGLLHIFNDYEDDRHIDFMIISIHWLLKAMMGAIFNILLRYVSEEKVIEFGVTRHTFDASPFSNNVSFEKFYDLKGFKNLVVFNDKTSYSFLVDTEQYACRELDRIPFPMTLAELYSTDLIYKYLIPQNVLASLFNEKVPLMNELYSYKIGYN
jgi:hypothetical protein